MVIFYVDYLLLMADNYQKLSTWKVKLSKKLPANHMGVPTDFLEVKLFHTEGSVSKFHIKYSDALVRALGL